MARTITKLASVAAVGVGTRSLLRPGSRGRRALRRSADRAARELRYRSGRLRGVSYRLQGRRPDPDVSDGVLADRVRSSLGRIETQLDLPRVHVMAQDHTILLHGDVMTEEQADEIEHEVAAVSGVVGVESYLHVGLLPGDTRPSDGARQPRHASPAFQRLISAAAQTGAEERSVSAVRAILSALAERLPRGEREHLETHLPADVRRLISEPRRLGMPATRVRTVPELAARVVAIGGVPAERAEEVIAAVFAALRDLVPEETDDIDAVLPPGLRQLWRSNVRA